MRSTREYNLQTEYPKIASQWDYEKNSPYTPDQYAPHSNKKVWWICPIGHSYESTVDHRTSRGYGCPYCSGKKVLEGYNDLKTLNPQLASEWNYEKNEDLRPEQFTLHSNKPAWWKCAVCQHEWKTKINDRANGNGCPICSKAARIQSFRMNYLNPGENDLATLYSDIAREWDYEKNKDRRPDVFTCASSEKVFWKCSVCGHGWSATIKNRVGRKSGCPKCMRYSRTSFPEQALFFYIKKVFPLTQNSYTDLIPKSLIELDIYIPEIMTGIEYDGKVWHAGKNASKNAKKKADICKEKGIRLIRISELQEDTAKLCDIFISREQLTAEGLDAVIVKAMSILTSEHVSVDTERDRSEIMLQYVTVIKNKSIAVRAPEYIKEWDYDKNGGITPEMVNVSSNKKYWWICEKGHSHRATPANKCLNTSGCPICSGRECLPGYNDLQTRYPEIAKDWDRERNAPLRAMDVMPGSQRKYWWRCEKGHSYQSTPNAKTASNQGCPICCNKKVVKGINDLATTHPLMIQKWNYERNGDLTPDMVFSSSPKKVWWRCNEGHDWQRSIKLQVRSDYCPVCKTRQLKQGFNDLATTHPDLEREWDYAKNGDLTPQNLMCTSRIKVWWKCSTCGKEWETQVYSRTKNHAGCPSCGYSKKMQQTRYENTHKQRKDLVSMFPDLVKEWDYERNMDVDPAYISPGSNKKVWWICKKGHHYQAWVNDRTGKRKTGCPYCSRKRKLPEGQE